MYGRTGLLPSDATEDENGAFGMPNNPGWKLDKWKFLPMIDESLQAKPDAKWYVFIEADTHIVWPNLMAWLARLDPDQLHYLGTETQIADVLFAHGGSGFIISRTAMQRASEYRRTRVAELDAYTDGHWAGDCVLGKVLADAGVPLNFSWPLLQNSRLGEIEPLTNAFYRQPWCYPVVGFHHLTPFDVEQMWRFDQEWFIKKNHELLLHSDVFRERIFPELTIGPRSDWDNLSENEQQGEFASVRDCETRCRRDPDCMQYSYVHNEADGRSKCRTSNSPRLGMKKPGVQSGWAVHRINATMNVMGVCDEAVWD
ncbi:hypothetical protein VTN77DRAFT_2245 [Rasamsonia byssochlamydoides]|uniref:uncharacterized protein n=1 Tax=Rasamsonia byssochlamydoides TaxID=89139 RepID=UPI0037445CFB